MKVWYYLRCCKIIGKDWKFLVKVISKYRCLYYIICEFCYGIDIYMGVLFIVLIVVKGFLIMCFYLVY